MFVFLISADFLDSWYCLEVELKYALSQIENAETAVIPLIVRECQWKKTELGSFLAAPKDGLTVGRKAMRHSQMP